MVTRLGLSMKGKGMQLHWKFVGAMAIGIVISLPVTSKDGFKEPRSDAEWKAFCEAPDYKQKLLTIEDIDQRERVAGTCLRAPWQKFVPSKPKAW